MVIDNLTQQGQIYRVATPVYEGPLDLLLHLIERAELDITKLALAQVTDQFLSYLHGLQETAADEVSAFLIVAARLIQIKSEVLLPRPPHREEGEEDPGEALARQLRLYKKFKTAANFLAELEARGQHTYLRLSPPPKISSSLDISGLSYEDLIEAARSIMFANEIQEELKTVVAPSQITIRQKIRQIVSRLKLAGRSTFHSFIQSTRSRLEVVVTFLAMLELIKRDHIQVHQQSLFGEIEIEPAGSLDLEEDFELEFGELYWLIVWLRKTPPTCCSIPTTLSIGIRGVRKRYRRHVMKTNPSS
jgi:segregation and condensation protein A